MSGRGPLSGYRILDMTQFESGTVCTETLAWFGAEIIKVERPKTGEAGRYTYDEPGVDSYGFIVLNMNKKSITCNAKTPGGLQIIKDLIAKCDVIVENMSPGSMERLGLSYEECKIINPTIIYASLKGFARDSKYANYPAFDPIAAHMGGFVSVTGYPDMPVKSGVSVADSGTGLALAMSIIAALLQKEREGIGQRVDIAMQDFIIGLGRSGWEPYYNTGKAPRRVGNGMPLEDVAPAGTYPCKPFGPNDFVHIYCNRHAGNSNWPDLCHIIGRDDLIDDPDMATPHSRFLHKEKCDNAIKDYCAKHTKTEVMDILAKHKVPAGALFDIEDFVRDPEYLERGMLVEVEHPQRGKVIAPGLAPRLSENHIEYECSPALGEHNEEIYKGLLGYSDEKYEELKEQKAF